MSFFDDASLVMIPSGYKDQKVYSVKPTDGTGDLTFSRASGATRVGPDGLIEEVRTNLVLQSEAFNTADWTKASITVTANSVANPLNAVVNADTIVATAGTTQKYIGAANIFSGQYTFSVYAKYVSQQFVQVFLGADAGFYANFDIQNGTASAVGGATASIVSVGSGWYRLSMSFTSVIGSGIYLLNVDSLAATRFVTTSTTNSYYAFGAQIETGDIATDYIATTTAAVSVGPVSGLPRLDYLNSTCPKLLLEPQRTNLAQYSEQFDNAYWVKSNATITANTTVSPDGYQNADTAVITAGGYIYAEFFPYAAVSGQSVTISVFAKSASGELVFFGGATTAGTDVYKIENYGNGWYRHSRVRTFTATASTTLQYIISSVGTFIIWGAQVEGSNSGYATSYIPTLGASVTRVADAASKTGITSLIGQSEGTLYWEGYVAPSNAYNSLASVEVKSVSFINLRLNNLNIIEIGTNGLSTDFSVAATTPVVLGTYYKIAGAYKSGQNALYINGVQVGTDATTFTAATLSQFRFNVWDIFDEQKSIGKALLFKTRLTNAQLAELTA